MTSKQIRLLMGMLSQNLWACDVDYLRGLWQFDIVPGGRDNGSTQSNRARIENGVLHLELVGLMMPRSNWMLSMIDGTAMLPMAKDILRAAENPKVKSAELTIDSPGGTVAGTDMLRNAIMSFRQSKPITAEVVGQMASAAYHVGSAATPISAHEGANVGSIGVYSVHFDSAERDRRDGFGVEIIRAGEFKALDNEIESLTPKARADTQKLVNAKRDLMVEHIAEGRGVSIEHVRTRFGDGSVFTATEAQSRGMVDNVIGVSDMRGDSADQNQNQPTDPNTGGGQQQNSGTPTPQAAATPPATPPAPQPAATEFVHTQCECGSNVQLANNTGDCQACGNRFELVGDDYLRVTPPAPRRHPVLLGRMVGGDGVSQTDQFHTDDLRRSVNVDQIAARERDRIQALTVLSRRLNRSEDNLQAAINDGLSIEAATRNWLVDVAADQPPAVANVPIQGGAAEFDKFTDVFCDSILVRSGRNLPDDQIAPEAFSMSNLSPHDLTREVLRRANMESRITNIPEEDALLMIQLGGDGMQASSGVPHMRPGDYPNILSNLAGKMMDRGIRLARVTYDIWSARQPNVSDFQYHTIHTMGLFNDLESIPDGDPYPEIRANENLPEFFQVDSYGAKYGLTPKLVVDDKMGAFAAEMLGMGQMHQYTINNMMIALLNQNPTMADGYQLYSAEHGNLVSSGSAAAPPSHEAYAEMRRLLRIQKWPGSQRVMNFPAQWALVPPAHETAAKQTLALPNIAENTAKPSDSALNTVRGTMTEVVEANLESYDADAHYTFANPQERPAFGYCFQTGYGPSGRRDTWFDRDRRTRWYALEGRFAVFVISWLGTVKNNGKT